MILSGFFSFENGQYFLKHLSEPLCRQPLFNNTWWTRK